MTERKLLARRTLGSGPPPDLLFGEMAYSHDDKQFYVGGEEPEAPTRFQSDLSPIEEAIADLDTSQAAQDNAIGLLNAATDSQADAIGLLATTTSTQVDALATLATNTQVALEAKANDADLAVVAKSGAYADLTGLPTLFSGAYGDLSEKPTLFSGAYADLSDKPTLFSGAYSDLSGRPIIPAGFTYDQQGEPSGPAAGATWRERSAGGLIVGEWEWLSTFAAWVAINSYDIVGLSLTGSGTTSFTSINLQSKKRLIQAVSLTVQTVSGTYNETNFLTFTPLYQTNFSTTVLNASTAALVVNASGIFTKTTAINSIYTFDTARIFRAATGTTGNSTGAMTTKVRDVRQ